MQELKSGKKVVVSMSLLAFELLHHFLYKEEHFFILFMLNQYVSLRIVRKKPESVDIQLSNVPRDIENVIKRNKVKDEDLHSILQKEQLVEQVIPMKWGVIPQSHELAKQMNDHESLNGDSGENVPHCAGPVPNRIDAFNLMVNEKLLLRQSDAQKVQVCTYSICSIYACSNLMIYDCKPSWIKTRYLPHCVLRLPMKIRN